MADLCVMLSECNLVGNHREWWIDSGATQHVCANKELFSTFTPAQVEEKIFMANSATAKAVDSEIDSILSNHTWELVDLPPENKPLGSKWIFKKKMKVDGNIDKYKERLVVKDFKQNEDLDYFDTYSPVTRITSIWMLISLETVYGLEIHQVDVKTEFLNGELEEEIYMKQPEGFVVPRKKIRCDLRNKNPQNSTRVGIVTVSLHLKVAPVCIHCDIQAAIGRAGIMVYNGKSRHIRLRDNTIREFISSGIITVDYVKSKDNVSDSLTKGLSKEGVERISKEMGLRPRTSQHGGNYQIKLCVTGSTLSITQSIRMMCTSKPNGSKISNLPIDREHPMHVHYGKFKGKPTYPDAISLC
ncbi:hypothetical protein FXO38_17097 [Capsicum annuum]|nr:hypothetical protein FXO38_17097 [Capsicum annuum]